MTLFDELTDAEKAIAKNHVLFEKSTRPKLPKLVRKQEERKMRAVQPGESNPKPQIIIVHAPLGRPFIIGDQRNSRRSDPRIGRRKSDRIR